MGPASSDWWTRPRIAALVVALLVVGGLATGDDEAPPDERPTEAAGDGRGSGSTDPRPTTTSATSTSTTTATSTTARPTTTTAPAVPALPAGRAAVVGSITDGDTFRTTTGERIRLIGIDTPEVTDDECFADEATAAITRLIPPGAEVVLVADVEATDRFGRTLAYVHRASDGLFVNLELARLGMAVQLTVPPNVAHAGEVGDAVAAAREAGRGLWGGCTRETAPPAPLPVVPAVPTTTAGGACHPSYPTVCIPPAPPDLDCPQIPHRRFTVVGDDPHGFDGDHDGIGCESG